MATTTHAQANWTVHPLGKLVRTGIAVVGMIAATVMLTISPLAGNGSWVMILTGVALVITSVRVAVSPTLTRLAMLAIPTLAMPFLASLI